MEALNAGPLLVQHYSDVLCGWAYVGQIRMDELVSQFGDRIRVEYRFMDVYGHAREKLSARYADQGGLSGYAELVQRIMVKFPHAPVHPGLWRDLQPRSSMATHAFLCGLRRLAREGRIDADPDILVRDATWAVRVAFHQELRDISSRSVQLEIAESLGVPRAPVESVLDDGGALAELSMDLYAVREEGLRMSPTIVLDGGRQRLTGNVGYKVIEANVRELLSKPGENAASWC